MFWNLYLSMNHSEIENIIYKITMVMYAIRCNFSNGKLTKFLDGYHISIFSMIRFLFDTNARSMQDREPINNPMKAILK